MSTNFDMPIIGADESLLNDLGSAEFRAPSSNTNRSDRRQHSRYKIAVDATCLPLLPSLEIDASQQVRAKIVDINASGVGLQWEPHTIVSNRNWILAIDGSERGRQFIDIEVVNRTDRDDGAFVNATFGGPLRQLFDHDVITPTFNPKSFKYQFPFSDSVMTSLCVHDIAQRVNMDEILVCPSCRSLPTVRKGCSVCLSHETGKSRMIHHFACAHVDFVERFDQGDEIVCPKCLGRKMIVGADYEYLDGPTQCFECGHNDLEEIDIGHCLNCGHRFPFEKAISINIVGYRVNRLDPLALLNIT